MSSIAQDIRYGVRIALRSPALAITVAVTLALGLGANVAVFAVISTLLLRPPDLVHDPRTVVTVRAVQQRTGERRWLSYAEYRTARDHTPALPMLALEEDAPMNLVANHDSHEINGRVVSANYFALLGLTPSLGRFFRADEDEVPGRDPVAVLSYSLWQRRFDGDSAVLNRVVAINGVTFTVIGVGPAGFSGLDVGGLAADVWVSAMMGPGRRGYGCEVLDPTCHAFTRYIGRLARGSTAEQARAQLAASQPLDPADTDRAFEINTVRGVAPDERGHTARTAELLAAAVTIVLLVTCANVAGLMLARSRVRRREIALRRALGASTRRLTWQLVCEALPLAIAGCAGALLVAQGITAALTPFLAVDGEGRPATFGLHIDPTVVTYSFGLAILAAIVFGASPALAASRTSLAPTLAADSAGAGVRRTRLPGVLVVVQVALALVLAVGAGLIARSAANVYRGVGFDASGVVMLRLRPDLVGYSTARGEAFHHEVIRRLESLPGVEEVAPSRFPPLPADLTGTLWGGTRYLTLPGADSIAVGWNEVGPRYLAMLRIPLDAGRDFTLRDASDTAPVAIVNQTLARMLDAHGAAVGRTVTLDGRRVHIIGIARDAQYHSAGQAPPPFLYLDFWQRTNMDRARDVRLGVRIRGGAARLLELRRAVLAVDADAPISEDRALTDWIRYVFGPMLVARVVFGYSGALAVLLAIVGLYGLLLHTAARRRREIAIRVALGARATQVGGLIVREGMRLTVSGIAVGLVAAFVARRSLGALLYAMHGADTLILGVVVVLLLMVAYLASYLPARRASRVDAMAVLRSE